MKIWLLAENWPPQRGGIENYLTHIVEQLSQLGHTVMVVTPPAKATEDGGIKNIDVTRRRFFWPLMKPAWLPLFMALWRQAKKEHPDVIFCGKGLCEGLIGYYLHKYCGLPYIVFTYAMEINVWAANRRPRKKLQRVLGSAARVVHINDATGKILRDFGISEARLVKIAPGVDQRFLQNVGHSRTAAVARYFGIKGSYVLSVGRLVPRKGFDILIEAFSQLDQTKYAALKLVIVGEGPDRTRLEQLVVDNYMQTSVIFLGAVPDKHLPPLYAGALLFALTPRDIAGDTEGFGIVYLEAAAQGVTTVATATGGVMEAVVNGTTGLVVDPNDAGALHGAFVSLLSNPALCQRLGRQAAARVRQEFQWGSRQPALTGLLKPLT